VSAGGPGLRAELETTGFVFDIKRYAIHDGPGIRTTVFFKGCPLQCQWCHNPESWKAAPEAALRTTRCKRCGQCVQLCRQNAVSLDGDLPVTDPQKCILCGECIELCPGGAREIIGSQTTVGEVMAEIEKDVVFYDESGGGATFSGGEPLAQPEFLLALLNQCRAGGIHTAVDTCCYAQADVVDAVAEKADLFLCDIKHVNSEKHRQFTGVENASILDNIKRLCKAGSRVVIRIPIIPGVNDDTENIAATGEFAASLPGVERIDILPYNRGGNEKARRLVAGIDLMKLETPNDQKMNSIAERLGKYGFRVKIGG
jgi:pyruvate formate lyase activating enzyme